MSAISLLPEETRPRVIGLAPTHRAVGEMQSAGVEARTTASFLHDTQLLQRNGRHPISATPCFCSTRARWWGWPIWQKPTPSSSPAVDGRCPVGITTSCSPSRRASRSG
uniref:Multifunctional conjugation protein TraI n=1 Tax=Klebsiella pneumoniae TaxID=573 RepID=A0A2P1BNY0_KLEPN|nr:Multifunctional conjugation protein TraI [Klebsiella pneumoniae]